MPRAVSLTEALLGEFEAYIENWTLIPGDGGCFEVTVNDRLIYSKHQTGRHPEVSEIRTKLERIISQLPRA